MKTKVILFLILFYPFKEVMSGWGVTFENKMPSSCSGLPNSYILNATNPTITVNFRVYCSVLGDCPDTLYQVRIYLQQGSNVHLATYDYQPRNERITKNIYIPLSNVSINQDAVLYIEARAYQNADLRTANGYSRIYLNGATNPVTGLTGLTNGTNIQTLFQQWAFIQPNGGGCHIGSGPYIVTRQMLEWTIQGDFANKNIIVNEQACMGYSGANPNLQNFYGWLVSKTNTTAKFRTCVYEVIRTGYPVLHPKFRTGS